MVFLGVSVVIANAWAASVFFSSILKKLRQGLEFSIWKTVGKFRLANGQIACCGKNERKENRHAEPARGNIPAQDLSILYNIDRICEGVLKELMKKI